MDAPLPHSSLFLILPCALYLQAGLEHYTSQLAMLQRIHIRNNHMNNFE